MRGRRSARSAAAQLRFDGGGADSDGEKLGKIELGAIELTGGRFGAEDGRKVVLDVGVAKLGATAMVATVWSSTSGGVGHGRARGGMEELRGEVA